MHTLQNGKQLISIEISRSFNPQEKVIPLSFTELILDMSNNVSELAVLGSSSAMKQSDHHKGGYHINLFMLRFQRNNWCSHQPHHKNINTIVIPIICKENATLMERW